MRLPATRLHLIPLLLLLPALVAAPQGCADTSGKGGADASNGAVSGADGRVAIQDASDTAAAVPTDTGPGPAPGSDVGEGGGADSGSPSAGPGPIVVGAWNLHNFSKWGPTEFRLDDVAAKIQELGVDVLAVEELQVRDGTDGQGEQAYDALLQRLPGFGIERAPWRRIGGEITDTVVGLLYDQTTTTIEDSGVIFEDDWSAFPRAPLEVRVTVHHGDVATTFSVIVLHLKAFQDSVDRRRAACAKLVAYLGAKTDPRYVLIGDFNDDPYDPPSSNSFTGTFLDNEPALHFVTQALPPESVTSTGFYHYVNGTKLTGEFLDHAVVTGPLYDAFQTVTPVIHGVPQSDFTWFRDTYSDHFPLVITLTP